jgi:hypothetical protein
MSAFGQCVNKAGVTYSAIDDSRFAIADTRDFPRRENVTVIDSMAALHACSLNSCRLC